MGCAREEQFYRQMYKSNTKKGRLLLFYDVDKNGKRVPNTVGRRRQVAKT